MYTFREIKLNNIKGIKSLNIDLTSDNCVPNKVNFIVASNGRGKTTVATAFSKLGLNGLLLDKDELYKGTSNPSLSIRILNNHNEYELTATSTKNEISEHFDVTVINSISLLKSTTQRVVGGHVVAGKHLKSQRISIIPTNNPISLKYKYSDLKAHLSPIESKLAVNINGYLKDKSFIQLIRQYLDIKSQKKVIKAIQDFKVSLNCLKNSSKSNLVKEIDSRNLLEALLKCDKVLNLLQSIKELIPNLSNLDAAIVLLELDYLNFKKEEVTKVLNSYESGKIYDEIKETLLLIDPNKRFFSNVNGELVLEINNINSLSSGERDLLIMIATLERILYRDRSKKEKILIFDDIFDYLDGANILFFQYFILKIIERFKKDKINIFIFLFTHLDPSFFTTFQLDKVRIYNLENHAYSSSKVIEDLLLKREKLSPIIKEVVSKFYLHFSIEPFNRKDVEPSSEIKEFISAYPDPYKFKELCLKEIKKFIAGTEYDIYMVSVGIRVLCEQHLYNKLESPLKEEFLEVHGSKKIELLKNNNISLDPKIEILNKTYNELQHIEVSKKERVLNKFFLRINNMFIKNLLKLLLH